MWTAGIAAAGVALIVSSSCNDTKAAILAWNPFFSIQILFTGLAIPISQIPASIRWLQYVCPLKYVISAACLEEFHFVKVAVDKCGEKCPFADPGALQRFNLLELQDVGFESMFFYTSFLLCFGVLTYLTATLNLWHRSHDGL